MALVDVVKKVKLTQLQLIPNFQAIFDVSMLGHNFKC